MKLSEKYKSRRKQGNSDDSVLPLINVVFLLLIFFMIAGQINQFEPIKLTPPISASTIKKTDQEKIIFVSSENRFIIENKEYSLEDLLHTLKANASEKEEVYQVKVDGTYPASDILVLLTRMREIGVQRVDLITERKPAK
ncbi:MAG: biopolymer transporter ExbD [Sneathiellales bacterium]|nr:biopolymer transporter ExbD [Sneathiellales bacterium]